VTKEASRSEVLLVGRRALAARLRDRQAEIEAATLDRVGAVASTIGSDDPAYVGGLRAAVAAAVEYALGDAICTAESPPQPPLAVLAQVRRAAELGVGLEIVLRRLFAGHGSLVEFVMDESLDDESPSTRRVSRDMREALEALLARLTEAAAVEHRAALSLASEAPGLRRAAVVHALLGGQLADRRSLGYELDDVWHLGLIATGLGAQDALAKLQKVVGCELLSVPGQPGEQWAWLTSATSTRIAEIGRLRVTVPVGVSVAIGEPRHGARGWRLTHEEAKAALPLALASRGGMIRCADVLLEAVLLKDRQLASLLREVYLAPLDGLMRDGAGVIHETLRVYFASGHNVNVTATRLEVDRRTVWYRLDKVAKRLGCPPEMRRAELEVALRLAAYESDHDHARELT
jgi:hypothetical protein